MCSTRIACEEKCLTGRHRRQSIIEHINDITEPAIRQFYLQFTTCSEFFFQRFGRNVYNAQAYVLVTSTGRRNNKPHKASGVFEPVEGVLQRINPMLVQSPSSHPSTWKLNAWSGF
jgi:hypothetical protein